MQMSMFVFSTVKLSLKQEIDRKKQAEIFFLYVVYGGLKDEIPNAVSPPDLESPPC